MKSLDAVGQELVNTINEVVSELTDGDMEEYFFDGIEGEALGRSESIGDGDEGD